MAFTGSVLGYDPGGNGAHGVALCQFDAGLPTAVRVDTLSSAEDVIEFAKSVQDLKVVGVDTLTVWTTSKSGWRPADIFLRKTYRPIVHSITSPNSLAGSMGINGMAVLIELKALFPKILISETHPKALYYALTKEKYDYVSNQAAMDCRLGELLGVSVATKNDHEWDAAISVFAAFKGVVGQWSADLHGLQVEESGRYIWPCGKTFYWWPTS